MRVRKLTMTWGSVYTGVQVSVRVPESVALEMETLGDGEPMLRVREAMDSAIRDMVREMFPWGDPLGDQMVRVAVTVEEK